jgi:hypothetical protein
MSAGSIRIRWLFVAGVATFFVMARLLQPDIYLPGDYRAEPWFKVGVMALGVIVGAIALVKAFLPAVKSGR